MRNQRLTKLFIRFRDAGDSNALGGLFDALSPELLRVARHLARDEAEAEDLVQATFLTVMEHPQRFEPTRCVAAWMVGILTNEARAWGRGAARQPDVDRVMSEPIERETRERPEQLAVDAESRSLLEAALQRLPAKYREVLAAHLLRRLTPQEIAVECDASPATIRVQLHRGLAQLRPLLPAGLTGGLVMTFAPRGSAALRAELLATASRFTPLAASASAGTVTTSLGSLLMLQRIGLGAIVALALVGLWTLPSWLEADSLNLNETTVLAPELHAGSGSALVAAHEMDSQRTGIATESVTQPPSTSILLPRLRVRTLWADGSPASDVRFEYREAYTSTGDVMSARSDARGVALIEVPSRASYEIYGDRSGNAFASVDQVEFDETKVRAEQLDELRTACAVTVNLELDAGVDVRGRVIDQDGRAVVGAELWVSTGMNRARGLIVATSDADGRYLIRQLAGNCLFGARAEGHAPSKPEHVQYWMERQGTSQPLEIDLTLDGPDARARGVVLSHLGDPVAGARVRFGPQRMFENVGPTGAEGPPPPIEVVTDANGRFEAAGIAPGRVEFACQAQGYPVFAGSQSIAGRETAQLQLRLQLGAWVYGSLVEHSPRQNTMSRPVVSAYESSFWQSGAQSSFDAPRVETRPDGSYMLGPLAPGRVQINATGTDRKQSDRIELELAPNERFEWNPHLNALPVIRGIALDEHGAPLEGWTVASQADSHPGPAPRAVFTRSEGRFELTSDTLGAVTLALIPPDSSAPEGRMWTARRVPHAFLAGVSSDAQDVVLQLAVDRRPSAALHIDFVPSTATDTPPILATLTHERWGEVIREQLPAGSESIDWTGLPDGRVSLRVECEGYATVVLAGLQLVKNTPRTLPPIALEPDSR